MQLPDRYGHQWRGTLCARCGRGKHDVAAIRRCPGAADSFAEADLAQLPETWRPFVGAADPEPSLATPEPSAAAEPTSFLGGASGGAGSDTSFAEASCAADTSVDSSSSDCGGGGTFE